MSDESNGEEPNSGTEKRRSKRPSIRIPVDEVPARSLVGDGVAAEEGAQDKTDPSQEETAIDIQLPDTPSGSDDDVVADEASAGAEGHVIHETVHVSDIPPAILAGDIQSASDRPGAERPGFDDVTQEISISEADADELAEIEEAAEDGPPGTARTPSGKLVAPPPPPPENKAADPNVSRATAQFPALGEREKPWYESFFSDDYLRTVPAPPERHVARQCDFIEKTLNLEPGATVLDVGCGLGLHAVELASRGYLVVGLDLSLPMLSRAGDEAQDRGVKINFLHGDMREMTFDGAFDAVLCWGTTFGYFDDDANKQVIQRVFQALKPNGRALIDVVNRDYVVRSQPNLVWFEGDGCVCMEETQYNYISARLEVKRTVILDDNQQRESNYSVRLYALHELGQLLHGQGFRVASVSGHEALQGVFFGADSSRMIVLAERRSDGPGRASRLHEKPPPPPVPADDGPPSDDKA